MIKLIAWRILEPTAIKMIGERYRDFGPTLAAEKLAELHGIHLSVESARQLMIAAGYWKPRKGAAICVHPMRERRARLGELVQIDGSPHDWFEGRADRCTLLVFIDDATAMRGAKVTLHDHFDGTRALRWKNRKYTYTTLTKAQRKTAEADGKSINLRVEEAIAKRRTKNSKGHKPAARHPWRQMHVGKPATDSKTVTRQHG